MKSNLLGLLACMATLSATAQDVAIKDVINQYRSLVSRDQLLLAKRWLASNPKNPVDDLLDECHGHMRPSVVIELLQMLPTEQQAQLSDKLIARIEAEPDARRLADYVNVAASQPKNSSLINKMLQLMADKRPIRFYKPSRKSEGMTPPPRICDWAMSAVDRYLRDQGLLPSPLAEYEPLSWVGRNSYDDRDAGITLMSKYLTHLKVTHQLPQGIQLPTANQPQSTTPSTSATPSPKLAQPAAPEKSPQAKPTAPIPSAEPSSPTPWSVIVGLIAVATGLLWLLMKKRK